MKIHDVKLKNYKQASTPIFGNRFHSMVGGLSLLGLTIVGCGTRTDLFAKSVPDAGTHIQNLDTNTANAIEIDTGVFDTNTANTTELDTGVVKDVWMNKVDVNVDEPANVNQIGLDAQVATPSKTASELLLDDFIDGGLLPPGSKKLPKQIHCISSKAGTVHRLETLMNSLIDPTNNAGYIGSEYTVESYQTTRYNRTYELRPDGTLLMVKDYVGADGFTESGKMAVGLTVNLKNGIMDDTFVSGGNHVGYRRVGPGKVGYFNASNLDTTPDYVEECSFDGNPMAKRVKQRIERLVKRFDGTKTADILDLTKVEFLKFKSFIL